MRRSPSASPSEDSVSTISTSASRSPPRKMRYSRSVSREERSAGLRSLSPHNSPAGVHTRESRSPSRSPSHGRSLSRSPIRGRNVNRSASRSLSRSISYDRDASRSPSRSRSRSRVGALSRNQSARPRPDTHVPTESRASGHKLDSRSLSPRDREPRNYRARDQHSPSTNQHRVKRQELFRNSNGSQTGPPYDGRGGSDLRLHAARSPLNHQANIRNRERSLSPFSKRLAMTRAINQGQ